MATLTYLLDTSVLTRPAEPTVQSALRDIDMPIVRAALTDLEIGYSARNAGEWDRLIHHLNAFPIVDIETRHFERAKQTQRLLAASGLRGRSVPDLLIAACAEARGLTVLHYDADFDHIASVTGQTVEWIVPQGSID